MHLTWSITIHKLFHELDFILKLICCIVQVQLGTEDLRFYDGKSHFPEMRLLLKPSARTDYIFCKQNYSRELNRRIFL